MADATETPEPPVKRSRLLLLVSLLLAVVLGGGGFYATYSGLLLPDADAQEAENQAAPLPDVAFVPVEPLVISLGPGGSARHLRMASQLEVAPQHATEVATMMPRILDVLNGYLRAVAVRELEDPTALVRLRAQMLRRIQVVSGEGRVRDLLITEFVLH